MVLYIVRHGQTEENKQRILQGHLPGRLTEKGKEQVRQAAELLKQANVSFKCIVASDLKRAIDLATIITEQLHLPVIPMEMLRERDWGKYTGITIAEAVEKYRVDGKWMFPDKSAETEEEILRRAHQVLQMLSAQYPNDSIIVVTHGLFARNLIAAYRHCPY